MNRYDAVIVGGGPGGLRAAQLLARGGLKVIVLEKKRATGAKVCAGGLTRKCKALGIPDELVERSFQRIRLRTVRGAEIYEHPEPILFTFRREDLGSYQARAAAEAGAVIETGTRVTAVEEDQVVLAGGRRLGFRYLVGADGAGSIVRRGLGLPPSRYLACIQYDLPEELEVPEVHFDHAHFGPWCLWIFPHAGWTAVGAGADPALIPVPELRRRLGRWMEGLGLRTGGLRPRGGLIPYDFHGLEPRKGRYLVGDAAGLAFEFNGEGIYSALVSATEVSRAILEPGYRPDVRILLEKKRAHRRMLRLLDLHPRLSTFLHERLVHMPRRPYFHRFLMDLAL